jgi:hypothetical protein
MQLSLVGRQPVPQSCRTAVSNSEGAYALACWLHIAQPPSLRIGFAIQLTLLARRTLHNTVVRVSLFDEIASSLPLGHTLIVAS